MKTYARDGVEIILADCIERHEPRVLEREVTAMLTDPPYGIGYQSNHNTGRRPRGGHLVRTEGNFRPIHGDGHHGYAAFQWLFWAYHRAQIPIVTWGADHIRKHLPPDGSWITWDKLAGGKPAKCQSDTEQAWCSLPGPSRLYSHLWRGVCRAGEENCRNSRKLHPNQKPIALMTWCLERLGVGPGDVVVDPFAGSGTVAVACWRMGIGCVSIEIDPAYYEIAMQRLAAEPAERRALRTAKGSAP